MRIKYTSSAILDIFDGMGYLLRDTMPAFII